MKDYSALVTFDGVVVEVFEIRAESREQAKGLAEYQAHDRIRVVIEEGES